MKTAMSVSSGRRTVGVMLLATVVALALVVAIGVSANKASAATKVVTRSFSNSQLILIPEGAPTSTAGAALPYPSTIRPTFPAGTKVLDVNVILRNYSHTFPDDVDVLLLHRGTNRTIMSDVGGSTDVNNQTFNLDDEAANGHLPDGGPLVGGSFQPTNAEGGDTFDFPAPNPASANSALSGFDGLLAAGAWKLFVDDNAGTDVGRFGGGWTLRIRASVPQ
jgi:large repetitive protein